jgi:hypothetical protein
VQVTASGLVHDNDGIDNSAPGKLGRPCSVLSVKNPKPILSRLPNYQNRWQPFPRLKHCGMAENNLVVGTSPRRNVVK